MSASGFYDPSIFHMELPLKKGFKKKSLENYESK